MDAETRRVWSRSALAALVTGAVQLIACLVLTGRPLLSASYHGFTHWDAAWYASIVDSGYSVPPRITTYTNVGFFPGFPVVASVFARLFGLSGPVATQLTAELAALVFWTIFYRQVLRLRPTLGWAAFAGALVVSFPSAFFLQLGYSEALFMAALLGFLFAEADGQRRTALSIVCGVVLTATRLVGLPLVFVGVVRAIAQSWPQRPPSRELLRQFAIGCASLCGALAYFAYCQVRFGAWNVYFEAQRIAWSVKPNYAAVFAPSTWTGFTEALHASTLDPNVASRAATALAWWLLIVIAIVEVVVHRTRRPGGLAHRLPLYLCALGMHWIATSALEGWRFASMIRYLLPVFALLVLALLDLWNRIPLQRRAVQRSVIVVGLVLAASLAWLQIQFLFLFLHDRWVA